MKQQFFIDNRKRASTSSEFVVIAGYASMQRSNDASFHFEQEANFWYLTGIEEAGWWLILQDTKSYLVAPDIDEVHRVFDGGMSSDTAVMISGVDVVISHSEGEVLLSELATTYRKVSTVGTDPHVDHYDFTLNPGPIEMLAHLQNTFEEVVDCRSALASLRAIKQPAEIEHMREAIALTIEAFEVVKAKIDSYTHEYQIEADFTHHFRYAGAAGHAYDPIVASGKNACTLHYGQNQAALKAGDTILLDIGARVHGYPADITRTYQFGQVTDRQKAVHSAVVQAHQDIIALLRPGLDVREYMTTVDDIMHDALRGLGLLQAEADYRKYFPHSVSHGLGIDVHDSLGGPKEFKAGMVLTVEPGIYIPEEGIGVRIEDDILITVDGHENLSEKLATSL